MRQRASELLGLVAQGHTIEITDRGRPVALLTPLPAGGALEQMRAAGEIDRATDDVDTLPEPLEFGAGIELPSTALGRLRRNER